MCKSAQGKPIIMLDGSTVGKTVMEMEGSDRFKEYLKGQITELGDGLDMGAMNDFWFLACISDRMERPVTKLGSLEKVQEIQRPRTHCGPAEFEVVLAHTGGYVHCLNEAMRLKAVSCKAHSGNVPYHGRLQYRSLTLTREHAAF